MNTIFRSGRTWVGLEAQPVEACGRPREVVRFNHAALVAAWKAESTFDPLQQGDPP